MKTPLAIIFVVLMTTLTGCSNAADTADLQAKVAELQAKVDAHEAERATTAKNLKTFDDLDLVAFNNRDDRSLGERPYRRRVFVLRQCRLESTNRTGPIESSYPSRPSMHTTCLRTETPRLNYRRT